MKRSEQFKLFHPYYVAENERYEQLNRRATIYLTVVSGLSLFAGIKMGELEKVLLNHWITLSLASFSGIFVLACLFAIVFSLRVYEYKDVCDVEALVLDIEENKYEEEDIYSLLLANLSEATRTNRGVNDRRARYLEWAVSFLGLAVATFVLMNVTTIWFLT